MSGKMCKSCLLPAAVPKSELNSHSTCRLCREDSVSRRAAAEDHRRQYERDLEQALEDCRGQSEYDCLVNLSGGKDSCLLLHKLKKEYDLNVLAFTTDMNIPDVAWENIRRTIDRLDVPHISYRPPTTFYRKMFRFLLANQESRGAVRTVCYICAPLFEGYSLKLAMEKKIPLVLAGYGPGQPEPHRMEYEFSRQLLCETDWTPPELADSGLFSREELEFFWNPLKYPEGTEFPRYLAPFHAWKYSQEDAMKQVVKLGLIKNKKSANPIHSNCPINWLLMYSDLKNLGFNPYAPEFSKLIREGKANRLQWRFLTPVVNWMIRHKVFLGANVKKSLQWLGMSESELAITRPAAGVDYSEQIGEAPSTSLVQLTGSSRDATGLPAIPSGIPTTVDLLRKLHEGSNSNAAVSLRDEDGCRTNWNGKQLVERCFALIHHLQSVGIGRGDRVAVRGPSAVGWLIAEFAVQAIGGVVVGLDSHLSPRATKERLESVKAKLLINIGTQVESIESLDVVGELNLPQNGMAVSTDAEPVNFDELPDVLPSEMATIVFTSGTTGSPKQIAFTHFRARSGY